MNKPDNVSIVQIVPVFTSVFSMVVGLGSDGELYYRNNNMAAWSLWVKQELLQYYHRPAPNTTKPNHPGGND